MKRWEPLFTQKNLNERDIYYNTYIFSTTELIRYVIEAIAILSVLSYVFYHSFFPVILFLPSILLYLKKKNTDCKNARYKKLAMEFMDGIQTIKNYVRAGHSLENAMKQTVIRMEQIYGVNSLMKRELEQMVRKLSLDFTVEQLWEDFANRSNIKEIEGFAKIIQIVKRTGGQLHRIIETSANQIRDKVQVENEIDVMLQGKKIEQKVMTIMPIGILFYVDMSAGEMIASLYDGLLGRVIMTICLIVYLFSYWLGHYLIGKIGQL